MDEREADVIEAAQDLCEAWEASKYGPPDRLVKQAENALLDRVADLQAQNDGKWRRPKHACYS